jgi:YidC/Oxa1 family membrane protein insertase
MSSLFGVPEDAVYHLVFALTTVLTPVLGGLAAVAGIVVITMAVRLLVSPLTFRALRGQAAQSRLAPQVQRLRQRHAKQPERLQRELTALYQREGTSMFAGFAPLLVQWPVFSVLYLLFRSPTVAGGPNRLLSRDLLGVPLGSHWLSGAGVLSLHGGVFLGVLALLALACWFVARVARRALPQPALSGQPARSGHAGAGKAAAGQAKAGQAKAGQAKAGQAKAGRAGSGQAAAVPGSQALTVFTKVAPYLTVVIAAFAPLAGVIYLVTSTGWSAAERMVFAARATRGDAVENP